MTVKRGHDTVAWSISGKQVLVRETDNKSQSGHVRVTTKQVSSIVSSEAAVKKHL